MGPGLFILVNASPECFGAFHDPRLYYGLEGAQIAQRQAREQWVDCQILRCELVETDE